MADVQDTPEPVARKLRSKLTNEGRKARKQECVRQWREKNLEKTRVYARERARLKRKDLTGEELEEFKRKKNESARRAYANMDDEQRERIREYQQDYYRNHKARYVDRGRTWRNKPENREKMNERSRKRMRRKSEERCGEGLEAFNAHRRTYMQSYCSTPEYREESKKRAHLERIECPLIPMLRNAKYRAKGKGWPYTLNREWADAAWTGKCAISGIPFVLGGGCRGPQFYSPSIDRIDSARGYTEDNCRFVLWGINVFKGSATDADVYRAAKAIVENFRPEHRQAPEAV